MRRVGAPSGRPGLSRGRAERDLSSSFFFRPARRCRRWRPRSIHPSIHPSLNKRSNQSPVHQNHTASLPSASSPGCPRTRLAEGRERETPRRRRPSSSPVGSAPPPKQPAGLNRSPTLEPTRGTPRSPYPHPNQRLCLLLLSGEEQAGACCDPQHRLAGGGSGSPFPAARRSPRQRQRLPRKPRARR
jgi:hypothetical protein